MIDTRIAVGYEKISERFKEIVYHDIKTFKVLLIVIPVISIVFTLITYLFELIIVFKIQNQFKVFKSLMLHIHPITFVSTNQLISFVYRKNRDSQIVSASHAVFTTSPDAMISLNYEGIIEYINPTASIIFGYTPEQLLGQNIKLFLNEDQKETSQLFNQMELMRKGQTSLIYESDIKGTRDDGATIYLKITLIGFSSGQNKIVESFGLTCVDVTNDYEQKELVNEAKNNLNIYCYKFFLKILLCV